MKKHKLIALTLKEFSAVRKPAQQGATIDVTKSDDRLVILAKAFPPPAADPAAPADDKTWAQCKNADCSAKLKKSAKYCPDCGMSMTKAADPTPTPPTPPENAMTDQEKAEKAALEKKASFLEKFAQLTDAEKAFYARLSAPAQEAFITKSATERVEEMKPVYTSTSTGITFSKADDGKIIEFAKAADASAKQTKELLEKAEQTALEARAASELGHLPGTVQERAVLLKSIDGITDEKARKAAMDAVVAGDKAVAKSFERQGGGGRRPVQKNADAESRLTEAVEKYAADKKVELIKAWDEFPLTAEGQALYAEMEAEKRPTAH